MISFFVEANVNLLPKQFDQLSDLLKETSSVILGGLIIGTILSENPHFELVTVGIVLYLICVFSAIYFKRSGERNGRRHLYCGSSSTVGGGPYRSDLETGPSKRR